VVLAISAYFMRQATESSDEIEVLLAQLEDAREKETRAAALTERSRIARELHDVLAHSLSALSIQLEGAHLLARRNGAGDELEQGLRRAGDLAKEGLADARRAIGALRGDDAPALAELPKLVGRFHDLDLDVTLEVEGAPRRLGAEAELALYRAAQEALTNALRYAAGAHTTVIVRYGEADVALAVEDDGGGAGMRPLIAGGGKGLAGMRERVEALGGRMHAGPTDGGFSVQVEVPA
jgi:signal transduction histidine kinase